MGLPDAATGGEADECPQQKLSHVLQLAKFPGVHIKLSGFYALATPGHDYPHSLAHPFVKAALHEFGQERLLWGSDFAPSQDHVTIKQTLSMFDHMNWLQPEASADTC